MANPLRDFLFGTVAKPKPDLVEGMTPKRTFNDVIVPPSTRRALDHALQQIKKHDLIFHQWGLAERHNTGLGLAFNFAGPPGTGKTICAEAIANALNKKLLVVRYSEMESLWAGETGKNVSAVFHAAAEQDAVLFFDEADAIAGRRFTSVTQGYQREANTVVNVLLKELESFDGVVIFATNLAANFDPAFERRIRTHILFEMPGPKERAQIWQVQLHARKTPLGDDVNFDELGEKFGGVSGGDIKNAVLKAAQFATSEPGLDAEKKIHQRHFMSAMEDVLASKKVMEQSLFSEAPPGDGSHAMSAMPGLAGAWSQMARNQETLEEEVNTLLERVGVLEQRNAALPGIVERFDDATRSAQAALRNEVLERVEYFEGELKPVAQHTQELQKRMEETTQQLSSMRGEHAQIHEEHAHLRDGLETLRKFETEQRTANEQLHRLDEELRLKVDALPARIDDVSTHLLRESETWTRRWRAALIVSVATVAILAGLVILALVRP